MRILLLAVLLLPPAARAGDRGAAPVDWTKRETPLDEAQIQGLRRLGLRLEPDGRVLDLELKVLDAAGLDAALRLLGAGNRRQRLERLRALLAAQPQDKPLAGAALEQARQLSVGVLSLPFHHPVPARELGRLAALDLAGVAAVFDGGASGAPAIVAPDAPPSGRPRFPYLTAAEQAAGENLRSAAVARLSELERGRLILSRLDGRDGAPGLPPILVEPLGSAARYDANRRALVLDRDLVVAELLHGVSPLDLAARRRALARPDGLAQALAADPAAARRVLDRQDVLIAHELVHAWQDRRDPLFRQMKRGALPAALLLEYEEEAFVEKNLYLHEKLLRTPGAYVDPMELDDYRNMVAGYPAWREQLYQSYRENESAHAADIRELREIQEQRLRDARAAPAASTRDQRRKAALLRRLALGARSLDGVQAEHQARIAALRSGGLSAAGKQHHAVMARHELRLSFDAVNEVERSVRLHKAEAYAIGSGDAMLLKEIRSHMGRRR